MPRKLTPRQERALAIVNEKGDATIKEVAAEGEMAYPTACQALLRLETLGAVTKQRLGDGTNRVVYQKIVLEDPESSDPLERAFAAPAVKGRAS